MKLKSMWLGGLLLLVAFLFAVPTAFAAVKPPKPPVIVAPTPPTPPVIVAPTPPRPPSIVKPTPPSTQVPAARVTLEPVNGYLVLRATGLTPGTVYDAYYKVYGCGDPVPYVLGIGTGAGVRSDGTFTIGFIEVAELYYYAAPNALCEVVAYLTLDGSRDVATYPDGSPIQAEHDFYPDV